MIDEARAREIAEIDARRIYGDLAAYTVTVSSADGAFTIDYAPPPDSQGGGPHYKISGESGEILSKRYEQ